MPSTRKKTKKSSEILDNVINVLDSLIEKSSEWAYPSLPLVRDLILLPTNMKYKLFAIILNFMKIN